jgi:DNA polymerase-3 subunit beta
MQLNIKREKLLKPLQLLGNIVERKQTIPALANVLVDVKDNLLFLTGTDLETELIIWLPLEQPFAEGHTTVSARKLLDICRVLPDEANISIFQDDSSVFVIRAQKSRFSLGTLPAENFPKAKWDQETKSKDFPIIQNKLYSLLESAKFAMAQQDVRYYLNGMLLEIKNGLIRVVATDGHRMAINDIEQEEIDNSVIRVIVPYKAVLSLMQLLTNADETVAISVNHNHIQVKGGHFIFTSKLIDFTYPAYDRTIPRDLDKKIVISRNNLKQALNRVAILSNELFCSAQLKINPNLIRLQTNNPGHEEAEEEIEAEYQGETITVNFNISYLLDILNNIHSEKIAISMKDSESGAIIQEEAENSNLLYVVMPLR